MPYPSSFVNGAPPGERTINNVNARRERKDLTASNGDWIISGMTETTADVNTLLTNLASDIATMQALLAPYTAVRLATAAALPACTYDNGTSGVGATLTGNANGALTVDGVAVASANRILVKNQSNEAHNGIYVVTATGGASAAFVLTRATDFDAAAEMVYGKVVNTTAGSTNINHAFAFNVATAVTVGTTNLAFSAFVNTSESTDLSARVAYLSNAFAAKWNALYATVLPLSFKVVELTEDMRKVNLEGISTTAVKYPSDAGRGY